MKWKEWMWPMRCRIENLFWMGCAMMLALIYDIVRWLFFLMLLPGMILKQDYWLKGIIVLNLFEEKFLEIDDEELNQFKKKFGKKDDEVD